MVVIGGLGSLTGSAIAAVLVGLVQVYVGFYADSGAGLAQLANVSVVMLLAVVLLRDSERRAEVLGFSPFRFKLSSFVVSSLIATAGVMVYLLLVGTAAPDSVASTTVTVSILIMVVLGGAGTRWGAVAGAVVYVYVYLQQYLLKVAAEPSFGSLPAVLRVPLSQPDFLLGALFIVFILFAPGGIAGLARGVAGRRRRARQSL